MSGLRARWLAWRNRLLSSPRFQRYAARVPLTRGVARRRARALFDLVAGFAYSQTLYAFVQAGLGELLAGPPLPLDQIAAAIDLPGESAERLLKASAALGLAERIGDHWTLGQAGAALRGNGGIAEMIAHHHLLYADLADPIALLRRGGGGGALSAYWRYAESPGGGSAGDVAAYSRLMAASQPLIAGQVLDAYPFSRYRRLLDIGGGEGAFLAAVRARAPRLSLALFDLPAVASRATAVLGPDVTVHGGDFFTDRLPTGHDLITLVRVLHDHDDERVDRLLRGIFEALPRDGTLLIAEPMAGTPGAGPAGDAYFGLYLLAMGSGRPRTPDEIVAMLRAVGFASARLLPTAMPLTVRVIAARR